MENTTVGHTPGPWTVGGDSGNAWIQPLDPAASCICDLVVSGFDRDTCETFMTAIDEANANLIAAAPDLLAALKELLTFAPSPWSEQRHAIERSEAAIAKAEGRAR